MRQILKSFLKDERERQRALRRCSQSFGSKQLKTQRWNDSPALISTWKRGRRSRPLTQVPNLLLTSSNSDSAIQVEIVLSLQETPQRTKKHHFYKILHICWLDRCTIVSWTSFNAQMQLNQPNQPGAQPHCPLDSCSERSIMNSAAARAWSGSSDEEVKMLQKCPQRHQDRMLNVR